MIEILLERVIATNLVDKYGDTALGIAVQHGDKDIAQLLVIRGAKPNMVIIQGLTPLLWCIEGCINDLSNIVQLFLDVRAEPNFAHESGWTPLPYAAH